MEWVETTGKTVAEAKDAALDELGVDERDAEVLVVVEPRSGLFGIGRVDARVRARVRPASPRPKRPQRSRRGEDRSRGRSRERGSTSGSEGRAEAARPARQDAEAPAAAQEAGRRRRRRPSGDGGRERAQAPTDATTAAAGEAETAGKNGSPGAKRARREQAGTAVASKRPATRTEESEMTIEQQAAVVERFVSGVVERFGFDQATTSVRVEDDHVLVDVVGDDLGLLVGPRGRTLDALQELARTVVQRRGEEGGTRVVVDVAGYRAKRAAALEAFVRRVADEVIEQGEPQALEPMGAADRKIVHDTATAIEGVETSSEGFEPSRYVVIRPSAQPAAVAEDADA